MNTNTANQYKELYEEITLTNRATTIDARKGDYVATPVADGIEVFKVDAIGIYGGMLVAMSFENPIFLNRSCIDHVDAHDTSFTPDWLNSDLVSIHKRKQIYWRQLDEIQFKLTARQASEIKEQLNEVVQRRQEDAMDEIMPWAA